uniref:Ig-like domain-containing protein n=1 Tax=Amphiprion percula TaxID=161767 RepID=A0A3P8TLZ7_AMPPE
MLYNVYCWCTLYNDNKGFLFYSILFYSILFYSILFYSILFYSNGALLYANLGDDVTLFCHYASEAKYLLWYKQVAGEKPQIISSFYKHSPDSISFHNQFQGNQRFSVQTGQGFYHLKISDIQDSDSAMYYCGQNNMIGTEFGNGTFLVLKESSCWSFLQQPKSDSVQTGGSATLSCTVLADGKRNIYWFKRDSGSSHLGIIYTQTNSSSQCVKNPDSPEQRCVFRLPKSNVSLSDAGMYYCAVASCGEILFGKGTRLNSEEFNAMQYVALNFKKRQNTSRRQNNTEEETIYSGVKLSELE